MIAQRAGPEDICGLLLELNCTSTYELEIQTKYNAFGLDTKEGSIIFHF